MMDEVTIVHYNYLMSIHYTTIITTTITNNNNYNDTHWHSPLDDAHAILVSSCDQIHSYTIPILHTRVVTNPQPTDGTNYQYND